MKTTVITVFLLVFLIPGAEAGTILKLKNGNTMEWSNFTEEADQYCTQKSIGLFCIPKNSVASIVAKEEENPDAVVIVNKSSNAGKEATSKEAECQRLWDDVEKYKPGVTEPDLSFAGIFKDMVKRRQRKGSLTDALDLYNAKCQTPEQSKAYNEKKERDEINSKLNTIERKMNQTKVKQIFDVKTGQMKTCYDYGYTVSCY